MPKGLQVQTTGSGIVGGGQVHKFLDDGSVVLGSGSLAAGVDNKSVTFFDSTNSGGQVNVHGHLTASVAVSASFFEGDGSRLTNIPAPSSTNIDDHADADTTYFLVGVDGLTNSETLEAGDDLTFNPSSNVLTTANISGSTKVATARVEDVGGALALAGGAAVTIDATTTLDVTSTGAMTIDSGGVLTIDTDGTDAINLGTEAVAKTITIGNDASTKVDVNALAIELDAAAGIVLNSVTTTTLDATQGISIDAGDASNFSTSAGALTLDGAGGINIGTASDVAIDIDSSTLDIDASGAVTIDSTSTIVLSGDGGATLSDDTEGLAYDGSGNVDFDAVALDIDASGAITIDGTGTISIDGADDMNFSIATGGSDAKDLTIASTGGGDSSVLISSAGTGADALSLDVSAGSMVIAPSLADGQTLKLGKNGAVEMVFTPHGTAGNEKFLLTNTAGTAADAVKLDSTAGGVTLEAGTSITTKLGGTGGSNSFTIKSNADDTIVAVNDAGQVGLGGSGLGSAKVISYDELEVRNANLSTTQTTFNLINDTATTLNIGAAAAALNMGKSDHTGTTTISGILSASANISGSGVYATKFVGDGSELTNIPAPSTVNIDDTGDANTTYSLVMVDGLTNSETLEAGDDLTFNASTNVLTTAVVSGSTKVGTARLEDVGGALALAGGAAITIDATTGLSLDAGAASNFSTSAGALTLDGAGGINIGTASDVAIDVDASTFDLDASGAVTIDGAGIALAGGANASSFNVATGGADAKDLTISVTGGGDSSLLLSSAGTGADALSLDVSAGSMVIAPSLADGQTLKLGKNGAVEMVFTPHGTAGSEKFLLTNTAGTAADAIKLDSVAGGITLNSANTSHGVKIGTATSGVPITIGHTTSEVTVADNLTVTGDLTVNGTTTTVDTTNLLVKDKLITINDGGADNTARGAGIEFEENGSIAGFIKTSSDGEEFEFKVPEGGHTLVLDVDADKTVTVAGALNIEADSVINQDLSTDSTTATFAGLSLSDGNITNVGDINADSISVDDAATGLNVDFSGGNTGTNLITLQDGIADALSVNDGSNDWMVFNTSAETLTLGKDTNVVGNLTASMNISASVNISASGFYGDGSNLTGVGGAVTAVSNTADYHFSLLDSNTAQDAAEFFVENANVLKYNPNNDELMLSGTITAHTGTYKTITFEHLSGAAGNNIEISSEQDVVFVIDANGGGTQNYEFKAGTSSVAELDENGNFQMSGALSASLTISGASDLIIDGNAQFNGNEMVVTGTLHASAFVGDGSQLTNVPAPATVNIDDTGDADTNYSLVMVDGLTNSETLEAGDDLTFNASSNLLTVANVSGSTKLATARVEDAGGALAIFGGAAVTIDATTGLSLDAGAASNISTSAGALTVHGAGGINIGTTTDVAIDIDSTTLDIDASDAITIDSTSTIVISGDGGATLSDDTEGLAYDGSGNVDFDAVALDIDASGAVTVDGAGIALAGGANASSFNVATGGADAKDLTFSVTGGGDSSLLLTSAGTGADALSLDVSAGSMVVAPSLADGQTLKLGKNGAVEMVFTPHGTAANEKFLLTNTAGTAADAIKLDSTAGGITLSSANTSHGVKIATATSGVPVTIGHTTSEVTVADNLTVTGDLTVNGTTTTLDTTNLLVEDPIVVLNKANSSANGQGGIVIENGGSSTDMVFGRVANDTWGVGTKDTSGGTVTTLADMTLTTFRASKLEIDASGNSIDVDTDLKLVSVADIVLDPGGSDVKVDGNLLPNAADGGALGSADNEWSDLFLADDAIIKFGAGQDVQLAHDNSNQLLTFSSAQDDYGLKMPSVDGSDAQGQAFLEKIVTGTDAGGAGTAVSAYNGVMFYLAAAHGGSANEGQAGRSAQLTFTQAGKFYFIENGIVFPSPFISE